MRAVLTSICAAVWPAIGAAPNGKPQSSPQYAATLGQGRTSQAFQVSDQQLGVRAWGRWGCDGSGANCKIGACNGGLNCNDAGITADTIFAELGPGSDGRIYWDLSYAQSTRNFPISIVSPDGQTETCDYASCSPNECFNDPNDSAAIRNSAAGGGYTITLCPDGSTPGTW